MRALIASLLLAGCASEDPLVAAWHRGIRLEAVERGEGSCDAELEPVEPDEPWLFVATSMGLPDVASIYACTGPEACSATPLASVWIETWTEHRLAGAYTLSGPLGTACTVRWDDLDATRTDDGEVELTWRTFGTTTTAPDAQACDDFASSITGDECDAVTRYTGTQAD